VAHGPEGLQGASGRGRMGKARPRSASGLGWLGADTEAARRARRRGATQLAQFRFAVPLFEYE
jgi:hypothetical protein